MTLAVAIGKDEMRARIRPPLRHSRSPPPAAEGGADIGRMKGGSSGGEMEFKRSQIGMIYELICFDAMRI